MLKVLRDQFRETEMFGIGPEMSVEPTELVGGGAPQCKPQ